MTIDPIFTITLLFIPTSLIGGILLWKAITVMGEMVHSTSRFTDRDRRDTFQQLERLAEKAITLNNDERLRLIEIHMQERIHRVTQDTIVDQTIEQGDSPVSGLPEPDEMLADTGY